jgi:SAM-dependent methyltransferase
LQFLSRFHPELVIDNFSQPDGTITFYSFVKAAMMRSGARRVMDFGAGRGQRLQEAGQPGSSMFKVQLIDLRTEGAEVWACDVDPVVAMHPASHHQVVIGEDGRLPFDDDFFDVIVSDVTFEHVVDAEGVAAELVRVIRPGGYICARTPNKYGYVALATRLVPNRLHVPLLKWVAPVKQAQDVFPTVFRMNSVRDIRRLFSTCEVTFYRDSASPSYHFGSSILYRLLIGIHKMLPNILATSLCVFIRKPGYQTVPTDSKESQHFITF